MGERERQLVKKLLDDCEKEIREDERQRFLSSIKVKVHNATSFKLQVHTTIAASIKDIEVHLNISEVSEIRS